MNLCPWNLPPPRVKTLLSRSSSAVFQAPLTPLTFPPTPLKTPTEARPRRSPALSPTRSATPTLRRRGPPHLPHATRILPLSFRSPIRLLFHTSPRIHFFSSFLTLPSPVPPPLPNGHIVFATLTSLFPFCAPMTPFFFDLLRCGCQLRAPPLRSFKIFLLQGGRTRSRCFFLVSIFFEVSC